MTRAQHIFLFALVTLLALSLLHTPGTTDVGFWMKWLRNADQFGLSAGYKANQADYPPLGSAILFLVARAAHLFHIDAFIAFKLSLALFLLLTCGAFWLGTGSLLITVLLQLALILNSTALGYIDVYTAPPFLLALWALKNRNLLLFTPLYTTSCLIKWQPLIIAPFILIYLLDVRSSREWKRIDLKRFGLCLVAPALLIVAATRWVYGHQFVVAFKRALINPFLSGNALNFDWILTQFLHIVDPARFGGLVDGHAAIIMTHDWRVMVVPQLLFWALYTVACIALLKREKSFENLILYSLTGFVTYFTLNTGVHENHLFLACVLAAVLLWIDRRYATTFVTWTVVANANLFILYGADGFGFKSSGFGYVDLALLVSVVNVLIFAVFFREAIGLKRNSLPKKV